MPALRLASIVTCILFAAPAFAQTAPQAAIGWGSLWRSSQPLAVSNTPHPAIARITVQERDGVALGSGSLVAVEGDQGLVLTNWHVVRDAAGDIEVSFPDGYKSKAKVLKTDRDWDLAALAIWKPTVAPITFAPQAPQPGEVLTICGYGSGNFRAATARCTQYVSPGRGLPYEMVEVSTEARQGDSGGPILNERGEIAGVLFGAGGGTTSGSYVGRVRTFLASISPRLADPSASTPVPENIASTNPFVNPQGMPYLVQEANAKAANGDGWHAREKPAAPPAPEPAADDEMQAIASTGPRVEVPRTQFASRTSQITFGSLPDQAAPAPLSVAPPTERPTTSAPANPQATDELADDALPLWSRPLPTAPAPIVANQGEPAMASAESPPLLADQSTEVWQQWLGPTLFDQAKSVLAIIGVGAVLVRFLRSSPAAE